jgi:hypothetical protein
MNSIPARTDPTPGEVETMEEAFTAWWIENSHAFDGGCLPALCDLGSLSIRLNAAVRNARKS